MIDNARATGRDMRVVIRGAKGIRRVKEVTVIEGRRVSDRLIIGDRGLHECQGCLG